MTNLVPIGQTIVEIWPFFPFFKMAAVRHLGFVLRVFGHPRSALGGFYRSAKFGWNRCCGFEHMRFSISAR